MLTRPYIRQTSVELGWPCAALATGTILGAGVSVDPQSTLLAAGSMVAVVIVLALWAMPKTGTAPEAGLGYLFLFYLFVAIVWPSYISIHIGGLPWISIARLALFALALLWIYSIFNSRSFKDSVLNSIEASRVWFYCLVGFVGSQFLSIALSGDVSLSGSKFVLWQISWTLVLFIAITLATEKRINQIYILLAIAALIEIALVFFELYKKRLVWLDWLPAGFATDDFLQRIIAAKYRADVYRPQGSFTLNLMYAEFIVLTFPFSIYLYLHGKKYLVRGIGLVAALASLPGVYFSESRSGNIGLFVVLFGWGLLYALRRWQSDRLSMIGSLLLAIYVAGAILFATAAAYNNRIQNLTIGRNAFQAASTEARETQWKMGIPKIIARPLGYGLGLSSDVLGFVSGGVETIDSYPLTLFLEIGGLGFVCFMGLFGWAIFTGFRLYMFGASPTHQAAGPIAISLIAFLTIKLVLSQQDNHYIAFMLVGLVVALARFEETYKLNSRRQAAKLDRAVVVGA